MNVFCLLWVPLVYFFWRSLPETDTSGGVWAFILGSITAVINFFIDPLFDPGGFAFSRWLSGFILVAIPALLPFLVYFLMIVLGLVKDNFNFAGFSLPWLIPGAIFKALNWISLSDPIPLVLIPILWTAIALGLPFFISFLDPSRKAISIFSVFGGLIVPLAATSSYWAFYSQKAVLGGFFLALVLIPMLLSIIFKFSFAE